MAKNLFTTTRKGMYSPGRRNALQNLLRCACAWSFGSTLSNALAQTSSQRLAPQAQRLALLVGNVEYPAPHDLPPVYKNVLDLREALAHRGFDVTHAMNLDERGLHATVGDFVKRVAAAPANSVIWFYYAGHGMQVGSDNLLLGSGANPESAQQNLIAHSLALQQRLLSQLPSRPDALSITVIDACRTNLYSALGDVDGLNQVEAPLGGLVCFSTGAGKPALSPASADQNTFYTAALVKLLRDAAGHTTFNDLFRMVKHDVESTMLNHPLAAIRQLAQTPFIADNARVKLSLNGSLIGTDEAGQKNMVPAEAAAWLEIQSADWPFDLLRHCKLFLATYPDSIQASLVLVYQAGAAQAINALRNKEVKLFRTSFVLPMRVADAQQAHRETDLSRAARGDKDAAARVARLHKTLNSEQGMLRYTAWLQFAGGLGNGIACYELALHYRGAGQPVMAAQAEAKARQLGYSPPRSLGHSRK